MTLRLLSVLTWCTTSTTSAPISFTFKRRYHVSLAFSVTRDFVRNLASKVESRMQKLRSSGARQQGREGLSERPAVGNGFHSGKHNHSSTAHPDGM